MNLHTARSAEQRDLDLDTLAATWADPPGLRGWLGTIDHKRIGKRFLATALAFCALAGILGLLMRVQLAGSASHFLGPARYSQYFSMHGTSMVFLFALPALQGMALYLLPLLLGARNVALPRLAAFGYWSYLAGGLVLLVAFLGNLGPDAGWTGTAPFPGADDAVGVRLEAWALSLLCCGVSAASVATSLVASILGLRAPGMRLDWMPAFAWSVLAASVLALLAAPVLVTGSALLMADGLAGTAFFDPAGGGDPLLWKRLAAVFRDAALGGVALPAAGLACGVVEACSRRALVGYRASVAALLVGAGLVLLVGVAPAGTPVALAGSLLLVLAGGVLVGGWVATLLGGHPRDAEGRLPAALLYLCGAIVLLLVAGLAALALAWPGLGAGLRGSQFFAGFLHVLLMGGVVFPLLAALHLWFPKMTGKMLSASIGRVEFALLFLGALASFLPLFQLGLMGMPRRVYTFAAGLGWHWPNTIASLGPWAMAAGLLVLAFNLFYAANQGRPGGDNPWAAAELAWATRSPPPPFNFEHAPVVSSRTPLWPMDAPVAVVDGLSREVRELLATSPLAATPRGRLPDAGPSRWPLATAAALAGCGLGGLWSGWACALAALALVGCATGWACDRPSAAQADAP